jgi:hypothetical protein
MDDPNTDPANTETVEPLVSKLPTIDKEDARRMQLRREALLPSTIASTTEALFASCTNERTDNDDPSETRCTTDRVQQDPRKARPFVLTAEPARQAPRTLK